MAAADLTVRENDSLPHRLHGRRRGNRPPDYGPLPWMDVLQLAQEQTRRRVELAPMSPKRQILPASGPVPRRSPC